MGKDVKFYVQRQHLKPPKKSSKEYKNQFKKMLDLRFIDQRLIYIQNLPVEMIQPSFLKKLEQNCFFGQYGEIQQIFSYRDYNKSQMEYQKDTCFVLYKTREQAMIAFQALDGLLMNGQYLKVQYGLVPYCNQLLTKFKCEQQNCRFYHGNECQEYVFYKKQIKYKKMITLQIKQNNQQEFYSLDIQLLKKQSLNNYSIFPSLSELAERIDQFRQINLNWKKFFKFQQEKRAQEKSLYNQQLEYNTTQSKQQKHLRLNELKKMEKNYLLQAKNKRTNLKPEIQINQVMNCQELLKKMIDLLIIVNQKINMNLEEMLLNQQRKVNDDQSLNDNQLLQHQIY